MARRALLPLLLGAAGCAPLANLRPAGELSYNQRSFEVGAAAVGLGPRPYVIEEWKAVGQVWGTAALSRAVELSAIGAFDDSAAAAGAGLRFTPLRTGTVAAGGELELGYAWAAVSLPLAVRPLPRLWIYTAPRLGNQGVHLTPVLPAGVSVEPVPRVLVRAEAALSYAEFLSYERRVHLALGVAHQF